MKRKEIIVVPDVHGRTFWEKVKDDKYKDYEIVFLGDYLDPYPFQFDDSLTQENINTLAIENFLDIIKFARENQNRVHLLAGNHDQHYFGMAEDTSRMDIVNMERIYNIFANNKDLFNVAYKWNKTLFTHAGVSIKWIDNSLSPFLKKNITVKNIERQLNNILHETVWELPKRGFYGLSYTYTPLSDIGRSRGGAAPYGGCMWADASEMFYHSAFYNVKERNEDGIDVGLYQITGHSQLETDGTFLHPNSNWWMCDSREVFVWNEKKEELKGISLFDEDNIDI